jgi:hypothetical protein
LAFGTKKGTGSSGAVSLRHHTKAEHDLSDKGQKEDERCKWRQAEGSEGGKGGKGKEAPSKKGKFGTTKTVASAVEKEVLAEKLKAVEREKSNGDEAEACIMSTFQKFAAGKGGKVQVSNVAVDEKPVPTAPALKSSLKWVKNAKTVT